ncbi:MAG: type IV pilus assembly protein PilM [Candidatus Dojkabacteria bacterium]|nr:MAG: type IV pilus assembly protein PilM [Candidatus Dojkabacteria bacterium]
MALPQHFSIDFGAHSLKLVNLLKKGSSWELKNIGSVQTPPEVLNSYKEEHKSQMIDAVKSLAAEARVPYKEVSIALPESAVFSRVLSLPKVGDDEVTDAVYWQLKQFLPYPIEDVQSDYTQLSVDPSGQRKVLAVAAPKKLVELYVEILERAGLVPVDIESETLAILRSVKYAHEVSDAVVLDFGSNTTDMAIMKDGELFFSQSIATGADLLTKALVNEFQLSYAQAEEYKRIYGMRSDAADGKIRNAMKPVLDMIVTEVLRGVEFYKNEIGALPPKLAVLSGEAALLPALPEYMEAILGYEVQLADPWRPIVVPNNIAEIVRKSSPAFTVAIGLCLKE